MGANTFCKLQLGIGLAGRPRLLLLDEPAAGLSPPNVTALIGLLPRVRDEWGTTVLLVEHIMKVVMGVCSRVTVLNYGEIIAEGTSTEIKQHPRVIEAYLGRRGHA